MHNCPYDLERIVGEGGFAIVYRGIHRETGRPAAVKVQRQGPLARWRFRHEIDAMQRLDHLHVMPVLEIDPLRRWYAMPLARYSLRQLHDREPTAWDELRRALGSINGTLMHTHPHGFIHRDVTPDNILLLQNGHWVLADYGLVMPRRPGTRRPTSSGMLIGTEFFSAPEVLRGPASATTASDVYSIGAIATWFTNITPTQTGTLSPIGAYWSTLIRSTFLIDPTARWTTVDVASHLANAPEPVTVLASGRVSQCMRCGARDGWDHAERCLHCGT